ncbi:MAG: LysM peptidoglycan-binding domain-containing protein [Gemmatimonadaceae bacterium]|nr:LysM peptidoglycan-binding domain-containing protein [Chitinophagaceae bacterium]
MKNNILLLLVMLIVGLSAAGQADDLMINGSGSNMHLVHTVQAKESWFAIGRMYNLAPKDIAPFNGLTIDKALAIGQKIKIPLSNANFSQDGKKATDEVFVPVTHIIQEKEWLYRISMNYNKVPIENLEKWNNVNKDQAKAGTKLIVGYLKVKQGQSALASQGRSNLPVTSTPPAQKPVVAETKPEPVVTAPVTKPEPAKPEPAKTEPVKTTPVQTQPVPSSTTADSKGSGYFKSLFDDNGKSVNGAAGIFKSTSGWSDGKYYALMNNVPVGAIVKVNNSASNKSVYAKVLGSLPEMKESAGLTIRVSDAAASELGAVQGKFNVEIKY